VRATEARLEGVIAVSVFSLLLVCAVPAVAAPALMRGDRAWAQRADGQVDGRAAPEPIGAAIDAYESAVADEPRRLEASWKLLRALRFSANFATGDVTTKRSTYDLARRESERAIALLAEHFGDENRPASAAPDELRAHLAPGDVRDAARLYFWAAINLGEWGRIAGLVEAMRADVPNRLHDYARCALALDPDVEQGGALRLLSRMHAEVPYLPLVFGWVDRAQAVPLAARAVARHPQHPGNAYALALAILETTPERKADALALLERTAVLEPRSGDLVEDTALRNTARELLQKGR
jgi:hypothetical protein